MYYAVVDYRMRAVLKYADADLAPEATAWRHTRYIYIRGGAFRFAQSNVAGYNRRNAIGINKSARRIKHNINNNNNNKTEQTRREPGRKKEKKNFISHLSQSI